MGIRLGMVMCFLTSKFFLLICHGAGNSNSFEVKVSMHQGSAFSPLLFVIVMEALYREFRVTLPWELL